MNPFKRRMIISIALSLLIGLMIPLWALQSPQSGDHQAVFGSKEKVAFALQGDIYYLDQGASKLPDFSKLKPQGSIYTTELNVPQRSFDSGFPGVTDRFEWFAINYHGSFMVSEAGKYKFRLSSDDGSQLWIDGKKLIDIDGVHPEVSGEAEVNLTAGVHQMRVPYFQGPRYGVALQLEVTRGNAQFEIFSTKNYAPAQVTEEKGATKISLGSAILFDFNKSNLKPGADDVLKEIKESILDQHPQSHFVIEGYTDDVGSDTYNLGLSQRRAETVATWFREHGVETSRLTAKGLGKSNPKVPNTSDANRAQNRRVEISVQD
jgi:outer membrane protein OmpA-like peptidoglycan-associated protein